MHVNEGARKLVEDFKHGFFARQRFGRACRTFFLPGEGYWLDENRIQVFRKSTFEDFNRATPKPMPVFIKGNPHSGKESKQQFKVQEKGYHLCRKVAVSFDGEIFRATDREILAALAATKGAPLTDVATYVKAVQEVRRLHAVSQVPERGNGVQTSKVKRRRVHITT